MKVLVAAWYEFIKNMRDIKMVICLLFFPTLITFILGNAIGGYLSTDVKDKISVGYVNQDSGVIGKEFDKFLQSEEIVKRLSITRFDDKGESQRAIDDGSVSAVIHVPVGLTDKILKGDNATIELFGKKDVEFIESMTGSFISSYNSVSSVISAGNRPTQVSPKSSIKRIYYTNDSKVPRVMDYYAVLELLQVLVLGSIFGIAITSKIQNSDMHIRIHSLPTSRFTLTLGRILGSSTFLFAISVLVMLFTKYILDVNWNGNMIIILGTFLGFSLISVGIGVLVGTLVPNFSTALMIVLLIMMAFGIVSGAISPAVAEGFIGKLTPNYHAKRLIFGAIYEYPRQIMVESALYLVGFITAIYGLAAIFTRRAKYDNI